MNDGRANYLRFVGVVLLISFLCGLIGFMVLLFRTISSLDGLSKFLMIVSLISIIVLGPAMAVLFFTVANLCDGGKQIETSSAFPSPCSGETANDIKPYKPETSATFDYSYLTESEAKTKIDIVNTLFSKGIITEAERDSRIKNIQERIKK